MRKNRRWGIEVRSNEVIVLKLMQKKYVAGLGIASMKSFKTRNIIGVIAVALTSMLFTILASVVFSIILSFEQMNFHQIGTYCHGEFKNVDLTQINELKDDNRIKECGIRRTIGFIDNGNIHGEVGFTEPNVAKWSYIDFENGGLPSEDTKEAAADTKLLDELGVEHKIGAEFTVDFTDEKGNGYSEKFKLSGWWERNELLGVSMLLIPDSRINVIPELNKINYNLAIMLNDSKNIEEDMISILADHNITYFPQDNNGVDIGVNWGYVGEESNSILDTGSIVALIIFALLIFLMGYLIIYSIFRISVSNDIRNYGMLKTIGTSGKQIKIIVYIQALMISLVGTMIGLLIGYAVGMVLVPKMLGMIGLSYGSSSSNPLIFILSAVFSFATVFISCIHPASVAAKVSPIEALRYTESDIIKKNFKNIQKGNIIFSMAKSNVWRSRSKAIITILSISLSVFLFHTAMIFVSGIDINTYVKNKIVSDYIIADSSYLQNEWDNSKVVDKKIYSEVKEISGISTGMTYLSESSISCELSSDDVNKIFADDEELKEKILNKPSKNGMFKSSVVCYGMDDLCIDNLNVLKGSVDKVKNDGTGLVILKDKQIDALPSYKVGDKVKLGFKNKPTIIDPVTNIVYESLEDAPEGVEVLKGDTYDKEYEVVAIAELPYAMSKRELSYVNFALSSAQLEKDSGETSGLYCIVNVNDSGDFKTIKNKLMDISGNMYDVEDRESATKEYYSYKNLFIMLGAVLCVVVGLVGILNFFNTFLTSIFARKHEIAVLESIGMTKKQVKFMLISEGLIYTMGSAFITLIICFMASRLVGKIFEKIFWFYSYCETYISAAIMLPLFALLGIFIPMFVYRFSMKGTAMERLRIPE